jgi:hypothetical protein
VRLASSAKEESGDRERSIEPNDRGNRIGAARLRIDRDGQGGQGEDRDVRGGNGEMWPTTPNEALIRVRSMRARRMLSAPDANGECRCRIGDEDCWKCERGEWCESAAGRKRSKREGDEKAERAASCIAHENPPPRDVDNPERANGGCARQRKGAECFAVGTKRGCFSTGGFSTMNSHLDRKNRREQRCSRKYRRASECCESVDAINKIDEVHHPRTRDRKQQHASDGHDRMRGDFQRKPRSTSERGCENGRS